MHRILLLGPILLIGGLVGCDRSQAPTRAEAPTARITLDFRLPGAPTAGAARVASSIPTSGQIILAVWNSSLVQNISDTLTVGASGAVPTWTSPQLPAGAGWRAAATWFDSLGVPVWRDTTASFSTVSGDTTRVELRLRAVTGRLILSFPETPSTVSTLVGRFSHPGGTVQATAARGTSGRTLLTLTGLPLGTSGTLSLRAVGSVGDTLFLLDTLLLLPPEENVRMNLNLGTPGQGGTPPPEGGVPGGGSLTLSVSFVTGGLAEAAVGFPAAPIWQAGPLILTGFCDSGSATAAQDWIAIRNISNQTWSGRIRVDRGTVNFLTVTRTFAPGQEHIVYRAEASAELTVSFPADGMVWRLRDSAGTVLFDRVTVYNNAGGWPNIMGIAATPRTARLRANRLSVVDNDGGSSWCALGTADPAVGCP